jgi:hypothetical protein
MVTATKFDLFTPLVPAMPGALLTVGEVAEMLSVPPSWVSESKRRRTVDRVPGFGHGKYWRFREGDEWWFEIGSPVGAREGSC